MKDSLLNIIKNRFNLNEKEAIGFILANKVLVNDIPISKINFKLETNSNIRIRNNKKYVSRASYKLLTIVEKLKLDFNNKICLDIGSSTGGFTQVLLEYGAKKIYCNDCGTNQLHYSLRTNPKIVIYENRVAQSLTKNDFAENIDIAVMDISFTSSIPVIYHLKNELNINEIIVLIKPQFEYNKLKNILNLSDNFRGVVTDNNDYEKILQYIKNEIINSGYKIIDITESKIKGTKGNKEFLFYIKN